MALLPVILVGSTLTAKVQEGYLRKARERLDVARLDAQDAAEAYKKQRLQLTRAGLSHLPLPPLGRIWKRCSSRSEPWPPPRLRFRDLQITEDDLGKTRLLLMGESGAPTSGKAQSAFIAFQKAPGTGSVPGNLHGTCPAGKSTTMPTEHPIRPHTIFQLKYILVTDQNRES